MPKVASAFHINQTIELPVFFQKPESIAETALQTLDVKRAVLFYTERTKPFRKTQQLFISFTKPNQGAANSKAGLSRWIVKFIQTCYAKAKRVLLLKPKAHSTRKKGASVAFLGNIPMSDICKAATWCTPHIFTKHYCVDVYARQ